ncbi:Uncharacterised protein [Raoultella planticola]|nr:Uncharacterised protein [Raoultella planticola]
MFSPVIYMNLMYRKQVEELKKCIFLMVPVVIFMRIMPAKTAAHILTMSKATTMTINCVKRYAADLTVKNDITNFDKLSFSLDGISAVSWELPGCARREYGEKLLKDMYKYITDDSIENIHVMVQLVPEQPNTAIVKYKKIWGLIENSGVNTNNIINKISFIDNGMKGLVLTGVGYISKHVDNELQKLINSEEKLFLSNLEPYISTDNDPQFDRLTHWINNILRNDGVIFFLLGHFDERDTEVVALGSKSALKNII